MQPILWRALGKHIKSKSRRRSACNIYSAEQCVCKWLDSRQDGDVFWHATSLVRKQYLLATCDQAPSSSPELVSTNPRIWLCRACQTEMQSILISLFKGPVADVALLPEYPSQSHHSSYTESEEEQCEEYIQCCTHLQIQTFARRIISSLKGKVQPKKLNMSLFAWKMFSRMF